MVRTSFPEIGAEPTLQSLTAGCAFQRSPRTSASHAHDRQESEAFVLLLGIVPLFR
jgi:hypothetical protein